MVSSLNQVRHLYVANALVTENKQLLNKGDLRIYGAQNEAYMSRSAEKWVGGLCFNELGACD